MRPQIQAAPHLPSTVGRGGGMASAPATGPLLAGRFRPVRLLGEGAMGRVYEAEDVLVGDRLAVKCLRREWMPDAEAVERCRREVRAARCISHPNVCRVFNLVLEEGAPGHGELLLTMELIRGETLAARLERQGRLTPEELLPIARQLCDGLGAVHAAGIVHRDLKPANILLEPGPPGEHSERVVLTDFGLARRLDESAPALTAAGDLVGSPAYLAPEQVRGRPTSPATDVFALGVVLYELLTGALPFDGETGVETALARLHGRPLPPSRRVTGLDPRWDRTILRCLARDPAKRTPGVSAVLAGLTALEGPPGPGARTTGRLAARTAFLVALLFAGDGASVHQAVSGPALGAVAGGAEAAPTDRGEAAEGPLDEAGRRLGAGDLEGARELYQDVLAAARATGDRESVVRALTGLGIVRSRDNDLAQAERLEREALRLARLLGDTTRVASLLNNLGVVVVRQGRLPEAEKLYREAASLYRTADDPRRCAAALNNLGILLRNQGYLTDAEDAHHRALALRRVTADRRGEAVTLLALGRLATRRGMPGEAQERFAEALHIFRDEGHLDGVTETLTALAEATLATGDGPGTRRALDEALTLARSERYPRWQAEVARVQASAALDDGRPAEAVRLARQSLVAFEERFDDEGQARAGVVLAQALVAAGDGAQARELLARLQQWQWVRQDRGLRLAAEMASALADRAGSAGAEAVLERLSITAEEAGHYGLGTLERRVRHEMAIYGQSPPEPVGLLAALGISP